jgi:hypothetical protein
VNMWTLNRFIREMEDSRNIRYLEFNSEHSQIYVFEAK